MYTLRINFKSLKKDNKNIETKLQNIKKKFNIKTNNFFQVKNKNKIFTVLKSPHVNKKSREHFIFKNYSNKVDIKFNNFYKLINFLILTKKKISKNFIIKIKIIKN